ncbi:MAG: hypothetical protein RLZZ326_488, partial [Planctomycetota bacterium]
MPMAAPQRSAHRPLHGCLAIVVCLALIAQPPSPTRAAEAPPEPVAAAAAEAIPPPLPELWEEPPAPIGTDTEWIGSRFRADYDNGFAILPRDPGQTPFSLRIRNQNMFRYDGFARAEPSWTDSAGNIVPITNSNYFGIPRGRLIFSGDALLPRLSYLLNIDYNS